MTTTTFLLRYINKGARLNRASLPQTAFDEKRKLNARFATLTESEPDAPRLPGSASNGGSQRQEIQSRIAWIRLAVSERHKLFLAPASFLTYFGAR
jgi:hypothetical protein